MEVEDYSSRLWQLETKCQIADQVIQVTQDLKTLRSDYSELRQLQMD